MAGLRRFLEREFIFALAAFTSTEKLPVFLGLGERTSAHVKLAKATIGFPSVQQKPIRHSRSIPNLEKYSEFRCSWPRFVEITVVTYIFRQFFEIDLE